MKDIRINRVYEDTLTCEAIMRKAPDGSLIIICQCGDTKEPAPGNRVYAFSSYDDGETWSDPVSVRAEDGLAVYCTEVRVESGKIIAYLTIHNGHFIDWKCETAESTDNGKTWSPGESLTEKFCFVRGTTELSNGDTLIPCQMYNVTEEQNRWLRENDLYVWHAFYRFPPETRTDHVSGNIFLRERGTDAFRMINGPVMNFEKVWIWNEPTVVETSPGRLLMYMRRCGSGALWKSVSEDYGRTWSEAEKTDIPSPGNKPKLLSLDMGRTALIHTPSPNDDPTSINNRYPLAVWISDDGGESWPVKIDACAPAGNCSYPDGFYDRDNKRILFSFELNRKTIYFVDVEV